MIKTSYRKHFNYLIETGDMGDRMALGLSYNSGGSANGAFDTFSSPDTSQSPTNYYQVDQNKVDGYVSHTADSPEESDINKIKNKVSPDEVLMGIDYELKKMFYKNRSMAKQLVVQHLKEDPEYYSALHMLDFDSDDAKNTIDETLNVINSMLVSKRESFKLSSGLKLAINDTYEKRKQRSLF